MEHLTYLKYYFFYITYIKKKIDSQNHCITRCKEIKIFIIIYFNNLFLFNALYSYRFSKENFIFNLDSRLNNQFLLGNHSKNQAIRDDIHREILFSVICQKERAI